MTEEPAGEPAPPAQSFGRYLRQQRELRTMRLEDVARVTRVALDHLVALEADHFDELPGDVFTIGYIRGYARCIGLNADEAVLRFQEVRRGQAPEPSARSRERGIRWIWLAIAAALAIGGAVLAFLRG
jgi:cytoskeletal protein RodZ